MILTLNAMQSNLPLVTQIIRRSESKKVDSNFYPGDYDIICGRGKSNDHHPGNIRFRFIISMFMNGYKSAPTKVDKSLVIINIVDIIRRWGGSFVKRNKAENTWTVIDDRITREKVGHAIRDAMTSQQEASKRGKIDKSGRIISGMTIDQLMKLKPASLKDIAHRLDNTEHIIGSSLKRNYIQDLSNPPLYDVDSDDCSTQSSDVRTKGDAKSKSLSSSFSTNFPQEDDYSPIKLKDIVYQNFDPTLMSSFLEEGGLLDDSLLFPDENDLTEKDIESLL